MGNYFTYNQLYCGIYNSKLILYTTTYILFDLWTFSATFGYYYLSRKTFRTRDCPQRVPLRVKYQYSIKYVTETKFDLKIMIFFTNFEKSVLGSQESSLVRYLPPKGSYEPYIVPSLNLTCIFIRNCDLQRANTHTHTHIHTFMQ